ncbi:hypothetical protein O988_00214 [Pseudogymnoascus sp. VKM F-3808]|nr:hypothetical protein O988_00214 [Pseudogymnoascus sp. VKM F-3808]
MHLPRLSSSLPHVPATACGALKSRSFVPTRFQEYVEACYCSDRDQVASDSSCPTVNLAIARFSSSSTRSTPDVALETPEESEAARLYDYHLSLLRPGPTQQNLEEVTTAPIFTMPVVEHAEAIVDGKSLPAFPQYGLLAGLADAVRENLKSEGPSHSSVQDPRIFFNVAAPSSTFICGSQDSGKSHTLSCLLENCLIPSDANRLPRPLTGLVFHYDTFICDAGGSPCEAAFLSSDPRIKVVHIMPSATSKLSRCEGDLNTKRMLDLMAVSRDGGPTCMPFTG